jgi:hypothetical protein
VTPIDSWRLMMAPFESELRSARVLGATTMARASPTKA